MRIRIKAGEFIVRLAVNELASGLVLGLFDKDNRDKYIRMASLTPDKKLKPLEFLIYESPGLEGLSQALINLTKKDSENNDVNLFEFIGYDSCNNITAAKRFKFLGTGIIETDNNQEQLDDLTKENNNDEK